MAFTVRFPADDSRYGMAVGRGALNTGNGFDPKTGIFTAPVAGTYVFFLTQMGPVYTRGPVTLAIVKRGGVLDLVYCHGYEDQGSGRVTAYLRAGQQVWVRRVSGKAVRGN